MKRCVALLMLLALSLCLCACGKENPPAALPSAPPALELPQGQPGTPVQEPGQNQEPDPTQEPADIPGENAVPYSLDVWSWEEEIYSADDPAEFLGSVRLSLPKVDQLPQINAYYQGIFEELQQLAQSSVEDAKARWEDARQQGFAFSTLYFSADYLIDCNNGSTLSILRRATIDQGIGDPESNTFAETFDCASQGRMQLKDLFAVPEEEFMPRLSGLAEEAVAGTMNPVVGEIDPLSFTVSEQEGLLMLVTERRHIIQLDLADLNDLLKEQWKIQ